MTVFIGKYVVKSTPKRTTTHNTKYKELSVPYIFCINSQDGSSLIFDDFKFVISPTLSNPLYAYEMILEKVG